MGANWFHNKVKGKKNGAKQDLVSKKKKINLPIGRYKEPGRQRHHLYAFPKVPLANGASGCY